MPTRAAARDYASARYEDFAFTVGAATFADAPAATVVGADAFSRFCLPTH